MSKLKIKNGQRKSSLSDGYLHLAQLLLFCGILLTGVFMVSSAVATYTGFMKNALRSNCEALTANISEVYINKYCVPSEEISSLMQTAEKEYNYRLYMYNDAGLEVYPHKDENCPELSVSARALIEPDVFMQIGYYTQDAEEPQLCCAFSFFVESQDGTLDKYYLGAVSNAGALTEYAQNLTVRLVLCLAIAMLLFMLLFRLCANRMDRHFDSINTVVQKYAEGDFSARAEIPEHNSMYPFASTLHRMADFIEQNETTRKNFIANVSHELRTPMTTIGGFADGILDGTIPPEQHTKYTRIIADEIHRLRTLVNSMLNLTKFESGEMQLHTKNLDAAQLLIKTVLMFEKRISDKKVEVEGLDTASLMIKADEDLLFQVLYNLIENAVKFVNEGGTISFSLFIENKMAHIAVKNTGEGLADDEISKVFDRFYKTDTSRSQDKTGLGLGLSIARKIVALHQGHIVVKSVQGEYTMFEIQIPVNS